MFFQRSAELSLQGRQEYVLLETVNFLTDQLREVDTATDRIWVQTMALESGHFTNLLFHKMVLAQQRGVDVRLAYDAYSDYVTDNSFNHLPLLRPQDRQFKQFLLDQNAAVLNELADRCVVTQTNRPAGLVGYTPYPGVAGRDHKKITIIDNVAYIGGINLANLDAKRKDFMLKTRNVHIVKNLASIIERSFEDEPCLDMEYVCDANNTLVVDGGKPSQSLIMDHVYSAVDSEIETITLISPFLPSWKLRKKLNAAVNRGVNVEVITSEQRQLGFTPKLSQLVHNFGQAKPEFRITRYPGVVHAKALLLGSNTAVVGSHNFDELFVQLGTEEVSLFTTQPEIVAQVQFLADGMRESVIISE